MSFGNTAFFFLLWLVPGLAFFYLYAFLKKERRLRLFCGSDLQARLLPGDRRRRQRLKAVLVTAAVFFLIAAMVRPRWGFHWEDVKRVGIDLIVAVDVSRSMLAEDIQPSRLERAKRKIYDLCAMLDGDRIGLIAFAGSSFVQCPLTLDYAAFRMFLDYLSPDLISTPGTALGDAIRRAITAFSRTERSSKALILITDGEDHETEPLEAARAAKREGINIFTIGVGKPEGAPVPAEAGGFLKNNRGDLVLSRLDEQTLQKIALETGGSYVRSVTADMDLEKIYLNDIKGSIEQKELHSTRKKRWEERFQWFIFVGVLLLLAEWFIREHARTTP